MKAAAIGIASGSFLFQSVHPKVDKIWVISGNASINNRSYVFDGKFKRVREITPAFTVSFPKFPLIEVPKDRDSLEKEVTQ
jgi:hypothetical protein